jgi:HSP20 family protein
VDIKRCDGNLVVTAELPGLKKEEVKIEVTDNAVVIEGECKRKHTEDHKGFTASSAVTGSSTAPHYPSSRGLENRPGES